VARSYESWIIYNFLTLCFAYVGGPGAVTTAQEGKTIHPSCLHGTCCLPGLQIDGFFLRGCKQGALQFVILKPIMAIATLILEAANLYDDSVFGADNAYSYLVFMYNICYTVALYALLLFYTAASDLLAPHKPILKFVVVKAVVFFTFWQSLACAFMVNLGVLYDGQEARKLQNFLICCEMVLASIGMTFAFPYTEYSSGSPDYFLDAILHAASVHDVYLDIVHQFAGRYNDYVLYCDDTEAPPKMHLLLKARMDRALAEARLVMAQGAVVVREGKLVEVVRDAALKAGAAVGQMGVAVGQNVVDGVKQAKDNVLEMVSLAKEGKLGERVQTTMLDGVAQAGQAVEGLVRRAGLPRLARRDSLDRSERGSVHPGGAYDSPSPYTRRSRARASHGSSESGPASWGSVGSGGALGLDPRAAEGLEGLQEAADEAEPTPPGPDELVAAVNVAWSAALAASAPSASSRRGSASISACGSA
jgi:hypothetical protein